MPRIRIDASLDEETVRGMLNRLERLRTELHAMRDGLLDAVGPGTQPEATHRKATDPPDHTPGRIHAA